MKIEIAEFIPSDKTEIASASPRNDVIRWYRRD